MLTVAASGWLCQRLSAVLAAMVTSLNTVQPASAIIHTPLREVGERENGSAGVSEYSSVGMVLKTPASVPLTPLEEKLLTSLVRRSISQSTENVLRVKTGGQVIIV